MPDSATQVQVLAAAKALGKDEFSRDDVAEELGMEIKQMQPSWKAAKQAGQLEQVSNEGGTRLFRVAAE